MTVTLDDFDKCCRCCLVTIGPFKPLFGASLDEMVFQLVSLKMETNDSYPQQVCMRCILKLSAAFNFRQTVLNSHQVLTGIIEASKTDNKDIEELELKISVKDDGMLENCQSENIVIHETDILQDREQASMKEIDNRMAEVRVETEIVSRVPPSLSLPVLPVGTMSSIKNDTENNGDASPAQDCEPLKPYEVKNLKCPHCTKKFNSRVNLKVHMLNHKEACEVCGKSVSRVGRTRHMRTHAAVKAHGCGLCGRRFADGSNLARHVRGHAGGEGAVGNLCCYCGKRFKWRTSLYKHLRHHNGQMYECRVCGKKFADSSYLRIHVMTHSGTDPKPFMCELCGVSFTQKSSLTKHKVMVHAPQRQRHNCQHCNKSFLHKFSLRKHQARNHSRDHKQPHRCTECGKEFKLAKSLNAHLRHHKKTAEKLAEDKQAENAELGKQIIETVNKEPTKVRTLSVQYLCLACHKTFRTGETLQNHKCTKVTEEVKSEVLPMDLQGDPDLDLLNSEMELSDGLLYCKMCDLSFISSSDLLTHYRTVHDDLEVMDGNNANGKIIIYMKCL